MLAVIIHKFCNIKIPITIKMNLLSNKAITPKPDKPELNRKTFNFPILWNHLLKDIAKKSAAYLVVTTA